ncbi:5-dehydro-4-deoxy-D-glucuronate isomerase [Kibdelosporangium philippinense]|uniref:4-deoxy-L-threo-5-hexosulose-uronate ketol-isomerase n=1 Tax=Kibdelosporangium philippinense TaxID=211113 RepID=A0ABS8ZVA5_9PSEU|nr:5-dehydro-4-deoxy-D-glucuronate isomerase [Kibdelosporangium philippinense]MCE7011624.1 5-dehydro-4-deoxy-D-glucuronate isomerase [Kibdelosporangium philippinense]
MDVRYSTNPAEARGYDTAQLRQHYLVEDVFVPGELRLTYSHDDRVVLGGAVPGTEPLRLESDDTLRTDHFCERRELAAFCVDGRGAVVCDGTAYELERGDLAYIGRGTREVSFTSADPAAPGRFYLASAPAHQDLPTTLVHAKDVTPVELGAANTSNERTIRRYIDGTLVESCQLMMGWTQLAPGSVWNTMPAHTHLRRTECYFYFDLDQDARLVHLLGEPDETRHLIVRNEQAVISPSWSIHSGAATGSYSFIWFMAGENYRFDDMDHVAMTDLR